MIDTAWLSLTDPCFTLPRAKDRAAPVRARKDAEDVVRTIWWVRSVIEASGRRSLTELEREFRGPKGGDGAAGAHESTKLWFKYPRGLHVPSAATVARVEAAYPGTARELNHGLWLALGRDCSRETLERAVLRLAPEVQFAVMKGRVSWFGDRAYPGVRRRLARTLEDRCSLDTLAALVILARGAAIENPGAAFDWVCFVYRSLVILSHVLAAKGVARPLFELVRERVASQVEYKTKRVEFCSDRYCEESRDWCEALALARTDQSISDSEASELIRRAVRCHAGAELFIKFGVRFAAGCSN